MHRLFAPEPFEKAMQFRLIGHRMRGADRRVPAPQHAAASPQHFSDFMLQKSADFSARYQKKK